MVSVAPDATLEDALRYGAANVGALAVSTGTALRTSIGECGFNDVAVEAEWLPLSGARDHPD